MASANRQANSSRSAQHAAGPQACGAQLHHQLGKPSNWNTFCETDATPARASAPASHLFCSIRPGDSFRRALSAFGQTTRLKDVMASRDSRMQFAKIRILTPVGGDRSTPDDCRGLLDQLLVKPNGLLCDRRPTERFFHSPSACISKTLALLRIVEQPIERVS